MSLLRWFLSLFTHDLSRGTGYIHIEKGRLMVHTDEPPPEIPPPPGKWER